MCRFVVCSSRVGSLFLDEKMRGKGIDQTSNTDSIQIVSESNAWSLLRLAMILLESLARTASSTLVVSQVKNLCGTDRTDSRLDYCS